MTISTSFTISATTDGTPHSGSATAVGSRRVQYNESIPAYTTVTVTEAIDQSAIKSVFLKATGANVTLVTNGGGTGTSDTLTLVSGVPDVWYADMNAACPFTLDVTEFELYHGAATAVTVEIDIVVDATP